MKYLITPIILCMATATCAISEKTQPNILLILADDMGYVDLSIQGCTEFQTPNIDSIAKNGVRFKKGYVSNSVCAPSRAGLLSGRNSIGFECNLPPDTEHGLRTDIETMADMLKRAGYSTSCIGKWHLGQLDKFYPTNRGFDYFCGLREGSRSYFYDETKDDAPGNPRGIEINGKQTKFEGYVTDYFTAKAIELINNQQAQSPDTPFFMFLSYTAPHAPMHAKPELIERFNSIENEKRRIYAAMMTSLDEGVGRVLQCLDKQGLTENTLVVFLSDNGGPTFKNGSSNGPLRDRKGSVWEGGLRVPFLLQWPSTIPAGQILGDQINSLDLTPTFASAAGVEPVADPDGINLLPYLTGEVKTIGNRDFFWRRDHMTDCALRSGEFKWVENRVKNEQWLFNLAADIGEKNNLLKQYPEVAKRLRAKYMHWESTVPEPAFKSGWTPAMDAAFEKEKNEYEK